MNLHLKKVGLTGSLLTLLCCLGFGPLIALLSAVGAGFLVNDAVLAPLLVAFLVIGGLGLAATYRRHGRSAPLVVHAAGAIVVFMFTFVGFVAPLVWMGIAGLVAASVWDLIAGRQTRRAARKEQRRKHL
ncbi:MAG: MerC domain-containing protein [Desulfobacteraceae bacterium]|nr:MAG: MerC domain-containing protein [Desulfobacteraceae bacterium]